VAATVHPFQQAMQASRSRVAATVCQDTDPPPHIPATVPTNHVHPGVPSNTVAITDPRVPATPFPSRTKPGLIEDAAYSGRELTPSSE
jgi:hypothetical protein